MKLIQHITVGSGGAASITFSSIPGTFTDLILVCSLRGDKSDSVSSGLIRFNGSSANFSNRSLIGDNSAAFSADYTTSRQIGSINANTSTANTFSTHNIYIANYASSANKSFSVDAATESNGGYTERGIHANLWSNTAAITSIGLVNEGSVNFVQHSSATLYGILKGSDGITTAT